MKTYFEQSNRFLDLPLDLTPRILLLVAVVLIVAAGFLPLWGVTIHAPGQSDGLRVLVYRNRVAAESAEQSVEINRLHHTAGLGPIPAELPRLPWIWLAGGLGLLFLRAAVLGKMSALVDALVLAAYFNLLSLWFLADSLRRYGRDPSRAASAALPLFGHKKAFNLEFFSAPGVGSFMTAAVVGLLLVAILIGRREARDESQREARAVVG